jgi:cytochrome o ubiquinol oxidase operon protein cyoD
MSSARHEPQRIAHDEFHEPEPYTLRGYLVGFGVSALLTILAFWIVMSGVIPRAGQAGAFLHVNSRAQGGWTLIAYVFTAVLLLITIAGSVWIMYHLNVNMMPGMMQADPPVNQPP